MFTDPQVVTVNAVAKSMPRISSKDTSSIYQMADMSYKLTLAHTPSKDRIRSMTRLDSREVVADPLTAVNDWEELGIYVVIDRPVYGFSVTQIQQRASGLFTLMDSTFIGKLVGGES